jgi:DnaK suppressor protein
VHATGMNEEEKNDLKKAMLEKLDELAVTIKELKKDTQPMGLDNAIGRISRMDYINNKSVSEASLRKAENDQNALHRWLELLDTDRFGKCVKCGNEINPKRLLLLPASTKCIRCAAR